MKKFKYIKGLASTKTPWVRPSANLLNAWRKKVFKMREIKSYQMWLCGSFLEGWKTWDVDIIVTGKIDSIKSLESVLVKTTQIGFDHNQLIDINYNNNILKYIKVGACNYRGICCEQFFKTKTCDLSSCLSNKIDTKSIVITDRVFKNGIEYKNGLEHKKIDKSSLWETYKSLPSPKQIKRMQSGKFYRKSPVLITKNTDFGKFIKQ